MESQWEPLCVQCLRVSIPPALKLRQMDMSSLTCAQIWVRAVHMKVGGMGGGGGGVRRKQVCSRVDSEEQTDNNNNNNEL